MAWNWTKTSIHLRHEDCEPGYLNLPLCYLSDFSPYFFTKQQGSFIEQTLLLREMIRGRILHLNAENPLEKIEKC